MNKKVGRPPTDEGGAMTKILRVRVPQWMLDYLDDKGERSEVARQIIEDARKKDDKKMCDDCTLESGCILQPETNACAEYQDHNLVSIESNANKCNDE